MTNIIGTLKSPSGVLSGKLRVLFAGTLVDNSTTPDSIYFPQESLFTITSGIVNINLPETETKQISCKIEFYTLDTDSNLVQPPVYSFDTIIPNQTSVEFGDLLPTGIVNEQLATGALRIAKIIANDPSLAAKVAGAPYPQGAYSVNAIYTYGDLVSYQFFNYICKSFAPIQGILPTNTDYWYKFEIVPTGSIAAPSYGDPTPYGASWNGSALAPNQDTVYDILQTIIPNIASTIDLTPYARLDGASFTGNVTVQTPPNADDSTKAVSSGWVKAFLSSNIATAFTQNKGNNSTSVATTAFAQSLCRPAFFTYRDAAEQRQTANITTLTWSAKLLDTDNTFIANTGLFTVPAGLDGWYVFGGLFYAKNYTANSLPLGFNLYVNNVKLQRLWAGSIGSSTGSEPDRNQSFFTIRNLAAGDIVKVVATNYNTGYEYGIGVSGTFFPELIHYLFGFRLPI